MERPFQALRVSLWNLGYENLRLVFLFPIPHFKRTLSLPVPKTTAGLIRVFPARIDAIRRRYPQKSQHSRNRVITEHFFQQFVILCRRKFEVKYFFGIFKNIFSKKYFVNFLLLFYLFFLLRPVLFRLLFEFFLLFPDLLLLYFYAFLLRPDFLKRIA